MQSEPNIMEQQSKQKKKWTRKLRSKYKLVILNDQTYEERISFRLSRWNVFVAMGTIAIVLIALTIGLIAFTPLREYIPGYTDMSLYHKIDILEYRADSLEMDFRQKNLYLYNLKMILEGRDTVNQIPETVESGINYDDVTITRSKEDSILRVDFEQQSMYNIFLIKEDGKSSGRSSVSDFIFFTPLNGIITNSFNPREKHFGVDIVAKKNEAVKATLNGVVIFVNWTLETGYVIGIQHQHNLFSVYKHNSSLLKDQGAFVRAGEPIAIVGESGEYSTGPHLHFEIWYDGTPLNPAELMIF